MEVYFDDFKIEHIKSPIVSSKDYYPFGLVFGNFQRENSLSNQYQYNGKEAQDELNIGWFDYGQRMYQPEIGRFFSQDRFAEKYYVLTPYQYGANNPVKYVDVNGDSLIVTGPGSAQVLELLNKGLGRSYRATADKNGLVTVKKTGKGKATDEQTTFFNQLSGATDLKEGAARIRTVENDESVHVADVANGVIDVCDIKAIGDDPAASELGNSTPKIMLHEIAEQFLLQTGQEKRQGDAHDRAIAVENSLDPKIQRTLDTDQVRGFKDGTIFTQIEYKVSGSKRLLQVIFKNNNVNNVKLIK